MKPGDLMSHDTVLAVRSEVLLVHRSAMAARTLALPLRRAYISADGDDSFSFCPRLKEESRKRETETAGSLIGSLFLSLLRRSFKEGNDGYGCAVRSTD